MSGTTFKKYLLLVLFCVLALALTYFLYSDRDIPLGTQANNKVYPGYNLFSPLKSKDTYLVDNNGKTVFTWTTDYNPGNSVYLLKSGNLFHTGNTRNPNFDEGGRGGIVQEIKPDGTKVWEFKYSSKKVLQHHDAAYLPSGNVILIAWEYKSKEESVKAGRNPALITNGELWPDHLIEVKPDKKSGNATVVWEWHVWDHLIQDYDKSMDNYGIVADHPELINLNFVSVGRLEGGADWNHTNSVDYNEEFDQILLSVHNFSEIWIIDHSTTTKEAAGHTGGNSGKGGDLLYRWGNPQTYGAGDSTNQKFFVQHDATWIEAGLPGEGDILVFNNGQGRPGGNYSSVDQITPPVEASGTYPLKTGLAFGPKSQNWIYKAKNPSDFYAMNISGAQRLPNGNTLICVGPVGKFFEVTADKEVVWDYSYGDAVFKVTRYGVDYPGVLALDLQ